MSFCKESNKLVGTNNFLAWKKRTDLLLKENEFLDFIESIKDSHIPYVSKLETSKGIYDKLVELFLISTAGEVISL